MDLEGKNVGYVFTGSFCTFRKSIDEMKKIVEKKANVLPIMSYHSYELDTKFGKAQDFIDEIEKIVPETTLEFLKNMIGKKFIDTEK